MFATKLFIFLQYEVSGRQVPVCMYVQYVHFILVGDLSSASVSCPVIIMLVTEKTLNHKHRVLKTFHAFRLTSV